MLYLAAAPRKDDPASGRASQPTNSSERERMVTHEAEAPSLDAPGAADGESIMRVLSDADLALFALLAGRLDLSGPESLSLDATPRQPVPQALLAGLLTAEAARVAGVSNHARVISADLRFAEQAYSDQPLRISARAGQTDPTGALQITVSMYSEDGRTLATGAVLVLPG